MGDTHSNRFLDWMHRLNGSDDGETDPFPTAPLSMLNLFTLWQKMSLRFSLKSCRESGFIVFKHVVCFA